MVEIGISTIIETIWKTFRDRVSSQVTSVKIDDKGVTDALTIAMGPVRAAMSNALLDSKSDYPIIVVNTEHILEEKREKIAKGEKKNLK